MTSIKNDADLLRERRMVWLCCLNGQDCNSITNQIGRMLWNVATFRIINECRRTAGAEGTGEPQGCELLHEFMNEGFFAYQGSAIRRLNDGYPLGGKKGVNSVLSLLCDIKNHAWLFTRKNIFAAESLIYDLSSIEKRIEDFARSQTLPPELDDVRVRQRHEQIDRLVATTIVDRRETDQIPASIFETLLTRFKEASGELHLYVDKNIAHAATHESRALENCDNLSITLGHVYHAHRVICETVNFVTTILLGDSTINFLASPQQDIFRHIEQPLVTSDQIPRLRQVWDDFEEESYNWQIWGLDEFEAEEGRRNNAQSGT